MIKTMCIFARDKISYSFEIVSAHLVRPPKRPTSKQRDCLRRCPHGKACDCGGAAGRGQRGGGVEENDLKIVEEEEERRGTAHHAMHMGVNDVATLVLEDNQGITYDFYTFQVTIPAHVIMSHS